MKYKAICADNIETFNALVTEAVQSGWKLYGSPAMTSISGYGTRYFQALVL